MHKKNKTGKKKVFYKSTPKSQLGKNKQGKKSLKRDRDNEQIGIYKQMQQGFGFVDTVDPVTKEKKGYYTHESNKLDAFDGDEVAFIVRFFKGREEASITKVLKRSENLIIGTLKISKTFAFVIPENDALPDIFIPGKHIGGNVDNVLVGVQIINWKQKNPEGRIIESLEQLPTGREDIYKIAFEMGARKDFSEKVLSEAEKLKSESQDESSRTDETIRLTYTIDGAESKDLDDAISIEKSQNGYVLYVHIADVAEYVRENNVLDREARKRATSIYLVDQVIPMLPKLLSNDLCSLNPHTKKLTLTCRMEISKSGYVTKAEVYESIISSDYRLTYREIDEMLIDDLQVGDELQFGGELSDDLQENIKLLSELTNILRKNTKKRGALDFDFPETKIILDEAGKPIEYKKYERYDSYKIIEECMVLANESVAKLYGKNPFLFRVHEDPDPEDIDKFIRILESMGVENIPQDFDALLELIKGDTKLIHLQKLLLRSLSKAKYSEKRIGHFGLALTHYSHFTSPIRRYPDLQIHRIIKQILHKKLTHDEKERYREILPKVALVSTEKSDKAEKMEYKVRDMLGCKYMADKIGEQFTGNISGMIEKGFFVELENTIEGFVSFEMTGLYFDSEAMKIQNYDGDLSYQFGGEIEVRVSQVDFSKNRVEFEIA